MKHTKGPWYIHTDNETIKSDELFICRFRYPFNKIDPNDEIAANAHLIAAAPELLEALEVFAVEFEVAIGNQSSIGPDTLQLFLQVANKAIAKARGES